VSHVLPLPKQRMRGEEKMWRPVCGWVILLLVAACDGSIEEGGGAAGSGGNAAGANGGAATPLAPPGGAETRRAGGAGGGGGCVVDTDCALYADCCTGCIAVTRDYVPEMCALPCIRTCPDTARARCVQGGCMIATVTADPAVLGVWYYTWTGGNLSAFQIALCSNGRPDISSPRVRAIPIQR